MNDPKSFSLSQGQFFELAFSWIGFRLAVWRAWQLIVRMYRAGGPLAQAIIGARRAHELHRANREEKKKKTLPKGAKHAALPRRKSGHRTMRDTPSAIRSSPGAGTEQKWLTERGYFNHPMPTWPFHTGGIPSRCGSEAAATVEVRVAGC